MSEILVRRLPEDTGMRIAGESNEITRVTTSLSGGSFAARNGRGSNNVKPGELGRCEADVEASR